MKKAFLFDLDGTLLDTAKDMLFALQLLAKENNINITPSYEKYKELITHGSKAIVSSIFGSVDQNTFVGLQKRYLEIYQENLTQKTRSFEGIPKVLEIFDQKKISWGIVTNKPYYLSIPLLDSVFELKNCQVLIGGDTTPHSKPHPYPLLKAAEIMGIKPIDFWYIGDAKTDIEAARAANMKSAVASWGYLKQGDDPHSWSADKVLQTPTQLLNLI